MLANPLAYEAPDPVASYRVPYFLGDRDPEPTDERGIISFSCESEQVTTVELDSRGLDLEKLGSSAQSHLLRDRQAAPRRHVASLLGDRHRDALAPLGAATTKHFATSASLLTGAKAVGAFTALIVGLIGALHGYSPTFAEGDRYSTRLGVSSRCVCLQPITPLVPPVSRAVVRDSFVPETSNTSARAAVVGSSSVLTVSLPSRGCFSTLPGVQLLAFCACSFRSPSVTNGEFSACGQVLTTGHGRSSRRSCE
jgi:hypothetical protein